jgi:hypothetical protein
MQQCDVLVGRDAARFRWHSAEIVVVPFLNAASANAHASTGLLSMRPYK